jgi:uroporphyrin-3 C-methyltransferase
VNTQTSTDPSSEKGPKTGADRREGKKPAEGQGTAGLLSVAALIIALASAATAGWLWQQLSETRGAQSELAAAQARELAGLEAQVDQVSQSLSGLDDLNSAVGKTAEQMASELSDIRRNLGGVRTELINQLNAGAQDHGTTLLLGEAEHLMRIAAYQLHLRRDPTAALDTLALADERLAAVSDPLVVSVRETLARETLALAAVPTPDIAGAAAKLGALAEQAAIFPLHRDDQSTEGTPPETPTNGDATTTAAGRETDGTPSAADPGLAGEQSRWGELMDDLGQSLGRLVRVQKHNENMAALLSPDEERLMRQNLQIKFETARLALLERQSQIYRDTLEEAQHWLQTYFDTDDEAVDNALRQSDSLLAVTIEPILPNISGSLRQLRAARETLAQAPTTGPGS